MKAATPESGYKMPPKLESKYNKLQQKCNTCKAKATRNAQTCSLDEYIEYSGSELGKC
jgi:hypothetical protein